MQKMGFPVKHSILDADALGKRIIKNYPEFGKVINCELFTTGLNDTYVLTTDIDQYIAKVYASTKIKNTILGELELIRYLNDKQFPIAKAIVDHKGEYIHSLIAPEGTRHMVLWEYIEGHEITFDPSTSSNYAKLIATLHKHTNNWQPNYPVSSFDIDFLINKPLHYIRKNLPKKECKILNEIAEICISRIEPLPMTAPHYGICHGDIIANAIMKPDAQIVMFDFDWYGYGWRVYDISHFLWAARYNALPLTHLGSTDTPLSLWATFLSTYRSEIRLSQQEDRAIPAFIIAKSLRILGTQLACTNILGKALAMNNLQIVWDMIVEIKSQLLIDI